MIALHGIWNRSAFHLWGEDSLLPATGKRRRATGRKAHPTAHPFALSSDRLREAMETVAGGTLPCQGQRAEIALRLPCAGAGPLSSPELLRVHEAERQAAGQLEAWTVPSVAFAPAEALPILTGLPESRPPGITFGASLYYWAEAAKLSLELLAQGHFVPDVEDNSSGEVRAIWRPALGEGDVPERLRLLVSGMPPVCRALNGDERQCRPVLLVNSFLKASVDGAVRHALRGRSLVPGAKLRRGQATTLAERWLTYLALEGPPLVAHRSEIAKFVVQVRQWLGQLLPAGGEAAFRTCFRLEPPAESEAGRPGVEKPPAWAVSFHLQAMDDRSLLIDAARVWQERSGVLTFLERRFENPQERLLTDLGRASRLFPALEESLKSPRPAACQLSTGQAYAFLRESAPLLEQSGLGVLVPPWWQKPSARLGLRLKVGAKEAGQTKGAGLLGLDSLVEFDWEVALGEEKLSRDELERLAALKVPLVQVRGQWVELRPQEIEAAIRFFQGKHGSISLGEALRLGLAGEGTDTGLPIVAVEAQGWIERIIGDLSSGMRIEELAPPKTFRGSLRPYQVKGLSWLAFLDRFGLGACLADDMGLGKTIQLIALLLHERADSQRPGPTLLIAPMSVVGNWRREVERFAPSLKVMVHHGGERLSGPAFARGAKRHDLVISTYALAHRDQAYLSTVPWRRVVLDEAQNIKNPAARQTQAVRSLKSQRRVALTGTPVENRLSELWSIMEFLNPGYLGSGQEFRRSFAIPIEKYRDAERLDRFRHLVQPFILRRLKTDPSIIQDLPQKMEMKVFCNLTREQASLYEAVVKDMMEKIEGAEGIGRKGLVLATLMKLKQVCNHPAQFLQDGSCLGDRSGKLLRLVEMLEEVVAAGDRALVFTQFAEMGQMLKGRLQEGLMREVLFLHGGTPRKGRDEMVRRFQAPGPGPSAFVLSLKAGGLGLNLTAASHVFHFDRWWNPAVENQATDRAFRIGQKRNVQVYKYICAGTMEERIDQMMEQKKELAESVVGAGEEWLTEMSTDQLRQMLALSGEAVVEE